MNNMLICNMPHMTHVTDGFLCVISVSLFMANKMIIDAVFTWRFEQCMYIDVTLLKYGIF